MLNAHLDVDDKPDTDTYEKFDTDAATMPPLKHRYQYNTSFGSIRKELFPYNHSILVPVD